MLRPKSESVTVQSMNKIHSIQNRLQDEAKKRRAKALLLSETMTYQQIADKWKISKARVGEMIAKARREQ